MDYLKYLLLILSFWGILVFAQKEAPTSDARTTFQTSRSLLQSAIAKACNVKLNVRWYGYPAPTKQDNIASAGACCDLCQKTPGCKAWVWSSISQSCHLLVRVGEEKYCSRCLGGILDPNPTSSPSPEEILQNCADEGGGAARAPAIAACIKVTDTCAPAAPELKKSADVAEKNSAPSRADIVLEKSCDFVFTQTCKIEARNLASDVNPACAAILDRGPGEPRAGCKDRAAARSIFDDVVAELCDPTD